MPKLLIATNNAHKLEEYKEIFEPLSITLTSPAEEGLDLDPEETGSTFEENAVIKAIAFAKASGLPALADDSGLEVDALGGEPGVYSARYGNTARTDQVDRNRLVLHKLAKKNVPPEERTARFRCVIAIANDDQLIGTVSGTVEGLISFEPKGQNGFGYDPIFFAPELNKNLGEVSAAVKHTISHRGRAGRAAIPLIKKLFGQTSPKTTSSDRE